MQKLYPTVLRCYARPEGDHYLAVCLDLCLADQGPTLETAIAALEENLALYLESLTPEDLPELFPRSSPWWFYLDYYRVYVLVCLARIAHRLRQHVRVFVQPIALQPRLVHGPIQS